MRILVPSSSTSKANRANASLEILGVRFNESSSPVAAIGFRSEANVFTPSRIDSSGIDPPPLKVSIKLGLPL